MLERRYFKGDRWNKLFGYAIPYGAIVEVVRFGPRRKVLVQWNRQLFITMLWCLSKMAPKEIHRSSIQTILNLQIIEAI